MAKVDIDDVLGEGPQNWKEQLALTRKSIKTLKWVWRELAGEEGDRRARRMACWLLPKTVSKLMPFLALGYLVEAVQEQDTHLAIWAVLGIGFSLLVMEFTGNRLRHEREWAFGAYVVQIDKRLSELYFNHGVGQFLQEGARLSSSNVEKARGRVWSVIDLIMFGGISAFMDIGIAFLLVLMMSWRSAVVMLLIFVVHVIISVFMNLRVMRDGEGIDKRFRKHNRHRSDRWNLYRRVLTAGRGSEEIDHMETWMADIASEDRALWLWFSDVAMYRVCLLIVLFMGGVGWEASRTFEGSINLAVAVPLFSWSLSLFMNLWQLGHIERQLNWNLPSVQSMVDALLIPTNVPVKEGALEVLPSGPLSIELQHVTHAYPKDDGTVDMSKPVLQDFNLVIPAGCKVGLVGATGSGKSTVGSLMMRFMDPTEGRVLVNGHDLRDLDLNGFCRVAGDIPQHPQMLDDTLRENILYRVPTAQRDQYSDEAVWEVLNLVEMKDLDRFTEGLDTRLGVNGMKLSGGQRQRLAIASAIVLKLRLAVIDEATSALDASTERRVQKKIEERLKGDTTALIIAHRLPTLRFCDQIVVLRPVADLLPGEPQIEYVASSLEDAYRNSPTFKVFADELGMTF